LFVTFAAMFYTRESKLFLSINFDKKSITNVQIVKENWLYDQLVLNFLEPKELVKTESKIHKLLKQIVANELEKNHFTTYQEPLESPYNNLWWQSYRPDVLATKNTERLFEVVLVECETKPDKKRVLTKMSTIQNNLTLQKRLFEKTRFHPILAIPPDNLAKILCCKVRNFWTIWIINKLGKISQKIPRTNKNVDN